MAIMQRCLCFSNVRSGSQACGIYSLVTSIINVLVWSFQLGQAVTALCGLTGSIVNGVYAAYSINIMAAVFPLVGSIVLLFGISYDIKTMLIPYMVAITALMALQALAWLIIFATLGLATVTLIGNFVVWLLFTGLNVTCLLCVISQYQELQAGRGTATVVQPQQCVSQGPNLQGQGQGQGQGFNLQGQGQGQGMQTQG